MWDGSGVGSGKRHSGASQLVHHGVEVDPLAEFDFEPLAFQVEQRQVVTFHHLDDLANLF
jgi:hypothetical protein